ncbi:hypothetical protein B4O97_17195 [Marispirochaeta aestuarii]|uniref:Uncharacterized protein n=1 Tax=Marispirochaeta aestuarii TaxID=1963862 RepID=A0A1Y1RUQ2_9SPIO|nr:hypothetical protein [Marispirochaeta aestuarii]ORC31149.1 hypothetical protein B4O97_17195 [Marispirochaeta aestuarii]
MSYENRDYEGEYKISRLVASIQPVTAIIFLLVAELLLSGLIRVALTPLLTAANYSIFRSVVYLLSAGLIVLAFLWKKTIRKPEPGIMLSFLKWLIYQNHHRARRSSAVALLIPPSAMCEMCAVLGFVLFILSGGSRLDVYFLVLLSLMSMYYLFPTEAERDTLIRLDKEVP